MKFLNILINSALASPCFPYFRIISSINDDTFSIIYQTIYIYWLNILEEVTEAFRNIIRKIWREVN